MSGRRNRPATKGHSGASAADREGFQQLVRDVGLGRAGLVMGLEVSRLARNSTDWHRLLEICALTETLILDEDGLYDPAHFNDRLLLGLNRPDSNSTSYSSSRRSANSVEIPPRVIAAFRPSLTSYGRPCDRLPGGASSTNDDFGQ